MDCMEYDEFKDCLDKCSCNRRPSVKRLSGGWVLIRCPNPNCARRIIPRKKEWMAMVDWNKMIRS
jgi:hypothetical protein